MHIQEAHLALEHAFCALTEQIYFADEAQADEKNAATTAVASRTTIGPELNTPMSAQDSTTTMQPKGRALFLDRDGVVNEEIGYLSRADQVRFVAGIFDLCRRAQALGYCLIVVTNQAGIARGFYTEADFHALTQWMDAEFAREGVRLDRTYFVHTTRSMGWARIAGIVRIASRIPACCCTRRGNSSLIWRSRYLLATAARTWLRAKRQGLARCYCWTAWNPGRACRRRAIVAW